MFQWDLQLDDWDKPYGTPIPNCTDYKNVSSTIKAYRLHLRDKWDVEYKAHEAGNWYQPVWTGRDMPDWYTPPTKLEIQTPNVGINRSDVATL